MGAFGGRAARRRGESWILTIDGKTANGKSFRFTRDDLVKLGAKRISTHTPWHDGVVDFDGVPARDLMALVGATGERATISRSTIIRSTFRSRISRSTPPYSPMPRTARP